MNEWEERKEYWDKQPKYMYNTTVIPETKKRSSIIDTRQFSDEGDVIFLG
jgi:hypothetical protein